MDEKLLFIKENDELTASYIDVMNLIFMLEDLEYALLGYFDKEVTM